MTWFRGMERRGFEIHWLDASMAMDEKVAAVKRLIGGEKE
jgi:tRNA dimethylallyltransferase